MLNSQFPILIGWEFRIEHWSDPMRLCPVSKILEINSTKGFSMTRRAPAEPFKIIGNLYFVGNANGEVFLLTSPQGHIMMGSGSANSTESVQKNTESMGFKLTDIK